ncbi:GGDEF domain-containing protein [Cupriavidus basilensis]|uniref:diguanylate cyclase n=1 Tax=Cupriavidus basilensis TaxID=68895 RepID=A0A643FUL3_9BURK|nr:GGDEF domain-containing protein [Cupriavidus basilensis]MCP3021234.1 GGDEF domain-containing protein [Cupriavidus basilensis]MDR3384233.1 GGDEF domain-containing protein [Cupriavidus basilensis]QOT77449.1 GGDEF domain-containing protein [Cupriavidus basilensis]
MATTETSRIDNEYKALFQLAPVSLWLEDFSAVREHFQALRAQGVTDLRSHLRANPEEVAHCSARIRVLDVNQRTLDLFRAADLADLVNNLDTVFRDEMFDQHVEELGQLWDGGLRFSSQTVNYTLEGKRLDIRLDATVMPGHEATWERVLLSIEDITARVATERELRRSEQYALGLFEHSPVSLWVEDFSAVKVLLDEVRGAGISDFRTFLNVHPDFISRCMQEIRVLDVNQQTLLMFSASTKEELLSRLGDVFRDNMRIQFAEQLIDLWNEKLWQQREVINYALDGRAVDVFMQWSVFPGREAEWDQVLVSLTDITARKKAEAYVEFLGKHDVLTKLYNRAYYEDELARLGRKGPWPVSVIAVDLNGLKQVNDQLGHGDGDALLRRTGEALKKAVGDQACVARVGGDEFMVLLPARDERSAATVVEQIHQVVELNNQFYPGTALSLSIGTASCSATERLSDAVKLADARMYQAKRAHYEALDDERERRRR